MQKKMRLMVFGVLIALFTSMVSLSQESFTSLDGRITFAYPSGWTVTQAGGLIDVIDAEERNTVSFSLASSAQIGNADVLYMEVTGETLTADRLLQLFADELPDIRANMEVELGSSLGLPQATYEGTYEIAGYSGGTGFFGVNPIYAFDIPEEGYLLVTLRGADTDGMQAVFETVMESLTFMPFSFDPAAFTQVIAPENAASLEAVTQYVLPGFGVRDLILSDDSLIGVSGRVVHWVDLATAETQRTFGADDIAVLAGDLSPDKTIIAGGGQLAMGDDTFTNGVRLWDVETGEVQRTITLDSNSIIRQVGFSPDGSLLGIEAGEVFLIDVATGELLPEIEGARDSFSFSPDGTRIAASCPRMVFCVYDIATGEVVTELPNPEDRFPIRYNTVQFSPDGSMIAVGFVDTDTNAPSDLTLWDANTGELLFVAEGQPDSTGDTTHDRAVNAITFSNDGTLIASADDNGEIRLWDAATGAGLLLIEGAHGEFSGVDVLAFNADGTLLFTSGGDGAVKVWAVP